MADQSVVLAGRRPVMKPLLLLWLTTFTVPVSLAHVFMVNMQILLTGSIHFLKQQLQCANKVLSNSSRLVDFPVTIVDTVHQLPNGRLKFLIKKSNYRLKHCKRFSLAGLVIRNYVWASTSWLKLAQRAKINLVFFALRAIRLSCCIIRNLNKFFIYHRIPALPSLNWFTGQKPHTPVLFACIPGLHGGQSCLAPDGGSFLALSSSSLQIFGSIHMYFTCVQAEVKRQVFYESCEISTIYFASH